MVCGFHYTSPVERKATAITGICDSKSVSEVKIAYEELMLFFDLASSKAMLNMGVCM